MKRASIVGGLRPVVRCRSTNSDHSSAKIRIPFAPRVLRTDRPNRISRVPTTIVRLANDIEVLLPAGPNADRTFRSYLRRIEKTGTFPVERASFRQLSAMNVTRAVPDRRPIVGIVVSEPHHLLEDEENAVKKTIAAVEAAGCRPVVIPPRADLAIADPHEMVHEVAASLVDQLDGLIGLGGADVHPHLYGAARRGAVRTNLPRDKFEVALIRMALDGRVSMLGICRSHQLWNVATGGTLVQDVEAEGVASSSRDQRIAKIPMSEPHVVRDQDGRATYENFVDVVPQSRVHQLIGRKRFIANAAHHQALKTPGRRFVPIAYSTDAVLGIRMIQATETDRAVTVQFHPELRTDGAPERLLIEGVCRRARIFRIVRDLEAQGEKPTIPAVLGKMRGAGFRMSDHRWVKDDLAPLLARTKNAAA